MGRSLSFTELQDVPNSYEEQGTKLVRVNEAEDGLEFIEGPNPNAGFNGHIDLVATSLGVDLTGSEPIQIFNNTLESGLLLLFIVIRLTDFDNITVAPEISIVTNSTDYDNIIPATTLTGLEDDQSVWVLPVSGLSAYPGLNDIHINIQTPATADEMSAQVQLFGLFA